MREIITIALVGRPNVGKSSLFNCLCKKRIAIVEETEGVTRDRLAETISFEGKILRLIDTGGIDEKGGIPYFQEVKKQALRAVEEADSIILVVDGKVGMTALDLSIARLLLKGQKPVCIAVNKMDVERDEDQTYPFVSLGISNMIPVSAKQKRNMADLLTLATKNVEGCQLNEKAKNSITVSIIGRPNVGKSTLINFLNGDSRCVVSPKAGTTRDAIDIDIKWKGASFTFIDTAGIRKRNKERETVEKFASIRTKESIERSDVCILLLDSLQGMTHQEKRIAREIEKRGKGCILFFNKWDEAKSLRMEHSLKAIREETPFFNHCPVFFGSAKTGRKVDQIFPAIQEVFKNLTRCISTGQLNSFIERVMQLYHPPQIKGKRLRVYYLTQVDTSPPHFVLFVNRKELMTDSYKRYLVNQFRKEHSFLGCPIQFDLRSKSPIQEKRGTGDGISTL